MRFFKNLLGLGHHGDGHNSPYRQGGKHGYRGGIQQNAWGAAAPGQGNCLNCNAGNVAGARFCQQCGNSLQAVSCGGCGVAKAAGAKFCGNCGTPQ
ncbi:zinc ribbon domain-containing protein [Collimonas sp. H4R21]|uniref:Zinc ribbon domain-containing protein n=1 Tax=Collimonas rhizosphaerae TaxID=3126357 RepID=A0ABU9PRS9_9BURK